ncbi:MAG: molybdate ABC transporter substrate-binding protein [Lysobacterales bacterium]
MFTRLRPLLALCLAFLIRPAQAETLLVAAAADLRGVLEPLAQQLEQQHSGLRVSISFGSSGKLATQIEQGAPFAVYFAADERYPARLHAAGLTLGAPQRYARGRLVLWLPQQESGSAQLEDLRDARYRHFAIANPAHAPYGQRAQQALQAAGLWEALDGRLVLAENVAQAVQLIDSGAADGGIVAWSLLYGTPLAQRGRWVLIDPALHDPLWQAAVVTRAGADQPAAAALLALVLSPDGRAQLQSRGFELP